MRAVRAVVTQAISAAVESGSSGDLNCGSGKAKLRGLKRKGTSSSDLKKFVSEITDVEVPVVNDWLVNFEVDQEILLTQDDLGVWIVANNVCD